MIPAPTLENFFAWSAQVLLFALAGAAVPKVFRIHHPRFHLNYCYALITVAMALPLIQPLHYAAASPPLSVRGAVATGTSALAAMAKGLTPMRPLLGWILFTGILTRLGFFAAGALRIRHYRKSAIPLHFPKESILSVCKLLNRDVEVGVSANEVGPVTFGWIHPMILLPGSFLSLGEEAQRAILCHELLHVVRHDWITNVVEEIIGACLWFHPAIWWMLSQTKLAREQLVDAEVVRLTLARDAYVEALLAIAGVGNECGLLPAPSFSRKRHLMTRMRSLLQDRQTSGSRLAFSCASMSAVLLCAVLAAFNAFPLLATAEVSQRSGTLSTAPTGTPQVFTIAGDVTAPRITRYIAPEYSDAAREAKIEGMVLVEAIIKADGTVGSIEVKRSLNPELDHNAVYALQQWRFEPGHRGSLPIDVKLFIEMSFQLKPSV